MRLSILYETKPYSEMSPDERSEAKKKRAATYRRERRKKGRAASGSNEANKESVKKWRKDNPTKAKAVNRINYEVRSGKRKRTKDGEHYHHEKYDEDGGEVRKVSDDENAQKANDKRAGE